MKIKTPKFDFENFDCALYLKYVKALQSEFKKNKKSKKKKGGQNE